MMTLPPGNPHFGGRGWGTPVTYADNPFIMAWDNNDLRRQFNMFPWDVGLGATLFNKKFNDPVSTSDWGGHDYPIYRYPDLLLMYAEADNEVNGGPTPDGMEKLNRVRRRAYGNNPNVVSTIDYILSDYTKDTFNDLVLQERGYEFWFEGKRWLDLKRTGKAKEIILETKGIVVEEKHMLWPIPAVEYLNNDAIDPVNDQNPGY